MQYTLLTGATGLLGAYLLRDGMKAGRRFVVLVRSGRFETAAERVESLLARFEEAGDPPLPRPVVFEGDLTARDLGLNVSVLDWLRRHCDTVLHNAASLLFEPDEQTGEPRRSNVEGTRNVLELARRIDARRFYHVSTSYVCGLREDVCCEDELYVGQTFANVYEETKAEAEAMVRAADFLDSLTVFRPAIIVGDSRTGYTSTYHGFYTPLKVAGAFVTQGGPLVDTTPFMSILGMEGNERKNFVPVDWVSETMTFLMTNPEFAGKTYHLTPTQTVSIAEMRKVIEDALLEHFDLNPTADVATAEEMLGGISLDDLHAAFRGQMSVYKSYWRNDPTFDAANTLRAAPHLPCPVMNHETLVRMGLFALRTNFGWPKPPTLKAPFDVSGLLAERNAGAATAPEEKTKSPSLGLCVSGRGGGDWKLSWHNGVITAVEPGLPGNGDVTLFCNSETLQRLVRGELTLPAAIQGNAVHVECEGNVPDRKLVEAVTDRLIGKTP